METPLQQLIEKITEGYAPTPDEALELIERYPYFTLPALRALSCGGVTDETTRTLLARCVAVNTGDEEALARLADESGSEPFYPDETQRKPSTESAIDTFLSTYGSTSPEEEALLERMIFNPTPDYSQLLAREEEESLPDLSEAQPGSDDDLLNTFIVKQKQQEGLIPTEKPREIIPPEQRRSSVPPKPQTDNSLLSASLAKIFIKRRQYQRAYEIISQLSLNYPEKSIYFADQLRFLRKILAHEQRKQQKQ